MTTGFNIREGSALITAKLLRDPANWPSIAADSELLRRRIALGRSLLVRAAAARAVPGAVREGGGVSQTARILGVLQDGQPHLVSEIHERSGYSRLNSRISDLRARGYVIECFHVPNKTGSEGYGYTLISEPQACPADTDPPRVDARVAADPSSTTVGQLSFEAAA